MRKNKLNKSLFIFAILLSFGTALIFTGCPNPNGLHNQQAAEITFVFTNFGDSITGDYTIPGDFNDWAYSSSMVTMKNGEGTSSAVTISASYFEFTLIKTGDSGWLRSWYPSIKGNAADKGTAGNPYQNFYISGLDLSSGEITIVIDGASGTATPEVQ